jgi:hypothetical protein
LATASIISTATAAQAAWVASTTVEDAAGAGVRPIEFACADGRLDVSMRLFAPAFQLGATVTFSVA